MVLDIHVQCINGIHIQADILATKGCKPQPNQPTSSGNLNEPNCSLATLFSPAVSSTTLKYRFWVIFNNQSIIMFIMSFRGSWGESIISLFSLSYSERKWEKWEFWRSAFKTWTSNFIEWMLSLWVRFRVQYSLLLHYEILMTFISIVFNKTLICNENREAPLSALRDFEINLE